MVELVICAGFDKGFDAPAILVVGHQTDGKSALVEALMGKLTYKVCSSSKVATCAACYNLAIIIALRGCTCMLLQVRTYGHGCIIRGPGAVQASSSIMLVAVQRPADPSLCT